MAEATAWRMVFYDVEASSLSPDSYPVEVGWAEVTADGSVRSEAMLVRPAVAWRDWSAEAETIHGISREQLEEFGRPVEEVAAALDAAFGARVVYSDAPEWEARWTNRLYDAAGRKRHWRIGDAPPVLRATAATKEDNFWLSVHLEEPRLHRADADARVLAEAYAELRRRRERFGRMHVVPKPEAAMSGERKHFDPAKRLRDKQRDRDQDDADLASGARTAEEIQRTNSFAHGLDLKNATIRVRNTDAWDDPMPERHHVVPKGPPRHEAGEGVGPGNFYTDPAEAQANLDRVAVPVPLESWAGPVATADELEVSYGIPGPVLSAWERDGLVIAIPAGDRAVYPVAQFHAGRPVRGVDEVLRMAQQPKIAWWWLVEPHAVLGARPIDLLQAGAIARVLAEADDEFLQQR